MLDPLIASLSFYFVFGVDSEPRCITCEGAEGVYSSRDIFPTPMIIIDDISSHDRTSLEIDESLYRASIHLQRCRYLKQRPLVPCFCRALLVSIIISPQRRRCLLFRVHSLSPYGLKCSKFFRSALWIDRRSVTYRKNSFRWEESK